MFKRFWHVLTLVLAVQSLIFGSAMVEAKPTPKTKKVQNKSREKAKAKITKRITDHKTAYSRNAMTEPHVDIKVTPPGPRGKPGIVLVEVYNRTKVYLQTVEFEIELENKGWDRLSQTITVAEMEAGGSTTQEFKLPPQSSKSAVYSISDVNIDRMEMYSYDAIPVELNYNTDLILR